MAEAVRQLRVGVVGLGFGATVHVPGLRRLPAVDVCAVAGADLERTERVARELSIPLAVAGYEGLATANLDAVTLAIPPDANAKAVEFFLERGIPVLSEKPLAPDAPTAKALAERARGLACGVDFEFGELPAFRAVRRAVRDGAIGTLHAVNVTWLVESAALRSGRRSWKTEEGGGVLPLLLSHTAYLMEWFFGPVSTVYARLKGGSLGTAFDTVQVVAQLRGDVDATVIVSNAARGMSVHRWEILGSAGSVVLEGTKREHMSGFRAWVTGTQAPHILHEGDRGTTEDSRIAPFASLANRFVECVRSGAAMEPGFDAGWRACSFLDAVRRSALQGTPAGIA